MKTLTNRSRRWLYGAVLTIIGGLCMVPGVPASSLQFSAQPAEAASLAAADTPITEEPSTTPSLPDSVSQAVLAATIEVSGLAAEALTVLESTQQTWPDGCLGLASEEEICTTALVDGWRVSITSGQQGWIFRSDASGNQVRLEATLPATLVEAVLTAAAHRSGIAPEQLKISAIATNVWPDGCLGLEVPGESCTQALVDGWRVVVTDGERTWAYRTDTQGLAIRYESILPRSVINAVYQAIVDEGEVLRPSRLAIIEEEQRTWPNGCLGIGGGRFDEDRCTQNIVDGWRVVVTDGTRHWVFHTDFTGSQVVLAAKESVSPSTAPGSGR
jgi:hypothetical protein